MNGRKNEPVHFELIFHELLEKRNCLNAMKQDICVVENEHFVCLQEPISPLKKVSTLFRSKFGTYPYADGDSNNKQ